MSSLIAVTSICLRQVPSHVTLMLQSTYTLDTANHAYFGIMPPAMMPSATSCAIHQHERQSGIVHAKRTYAKP